MLRSGNASPPERPCIGAWCSGSTWASDSHGVGSIPIAPANAAHPHDEWGCFFYAHGSRLRVAVGVKEKSPFAVRCIGSPKRSPPGSSASKRSITIAPYLALASSRGRRKKNHRSRCAALDPQKEALRKLRHKRSITIAPHLAPYLALAHNSGA